MKESLKDWLFRISENAEKLISPINNFVFLGDGYVGDVGIQ